MATTLQNWFCVKLEKNGNLQAYGTPAPSPPSECAPPPLGTKRGATLALAGEGAGGANSEIGDTPDTLYTLWAYLTSKSFLVGRIIWSNTPPPISYHGQCGLLALLSLTLSVLCVAG
jgi:hypothetical protein